MLPCAGDLQLRCLGLIDEIERCEQPVRDNLPVDGYQQVDTVSINRRAADIVDPAPMGVGAKSESERRLLTIEHAISKLKRQTIEGPLLTVVESRRVCDVVIGDPDTWFDGEILKRDKFESEHR